MATMPDLSVDETALFERNIRDLLTRCEANPAGTANLVTSALRALGASTLPLAEQTRRAERALVMLNLDVDIQTSIADYAPEATPAIRAGIVGALPPLLQARATRGSGHPAAEAPTAAAGPDEAGAATPLPAATPDPVDTTDLVDDWGTVWQLGTAQEMAANKTFLDARHFKSVRIPDLEDFEKLQDENSCGMVIYPSWWSQFHDDESAAFLRSLLQRSSIGYCKVDSNGLGAQEAPTASAVQDMRTADGNTDIVLSFGAGHEIGEAEVSRLRAAAELGRGMSDSRATIDGLSRTDRELLALGMSLAEASRHGTPPRPIEELLVLPISEGQSGCAVYQVSSDCTNALYIAKVNDAASMANEYQSTRAIAPKLGDSAFHYYCLRGRGVVLQRMVGQIDAGLRIPAPSLRSRIADAHHRERGRTRVTAPELPKLKAAIDRLVTSIRHLNAQPSDGIQSQCWLTVEPLTELANVGAIYEIDSTSGVFDPRCDLSWVERHVGDRGTTALVHGDLHAGNVLLVADDFPTFIDFGLSGSGPPAFDLVRISAAIGFAALRPIVPEAAIRAYFEDLLIERKSFDDLTSTHSKLLTGIAPTFACYAQVACRDGAYELLGSSDEALTDLLALTYLIGAQHLSMEAVDSSLVRAQLGALHPWAVQQAIQANATTPS